MQHLTRKRYKFIADPGDVRLGEKLDVEGTRADVVIVGAPWDGAVGTRPGSRLAPSRIRQNLFTAPYQGGFTVSDWGDVNTVVGDHEETWRRISSACAEAISSSSELLLIGGDSTVSYSAFKALKGRLSGKLSYVSFDAHPDVRHVNEGLTSGQVVRWVREADKQAPICVVGVRRHSNPPYLFDEARALGVRIYGVEEALNPKFLDELEELVGDSTLHLSVNMDVVDPAYAPGVNSPSVGGFTSREIIGLVRSVAKRFKPKVVDLVEYTPAYDVGDITAMLGATLLLNAIWV
ncbi:MAG: arginase family protein [Thermoprotei archaeon]